MDKKLRGYFTVEASFVFPMILFLYLLIITAALFLYSRCALSQDSFLVCMRAAEFTSGEEGYGEVIYGEKNREWDREEYIKRRLEFKRQFYPFLEWRDYECFRDSGKLGVSIWINGSDFVKQAQKMDPVKLLRERRISYA